MTKTSRVTRIDARAQTAAWSFDVFDTFLLRTCASPVGVYERAFQLSPVSQSHPGAVRAYVQHRIQADSFARRRSHEQRNSFEVTIEDIYKYFPYRLFGLTEAALASLVDAEFRAELDLCRVNNEVLRLYLREQGTGKRVGFISDTYWGEKRLANLLTRCKPGLSWDFLYASCDHGTGKGDGLFARYLAEQRIDPSLATHIGDNPAADVTGAKRHRIRARFYPQATRMLASIFERETSTFNLLCESPFGLLDQGYRTLRRIVSARLPERSQAFRLGLTTVGPAMMAFDRFLIDRITKIRKQTDRIAVAFLGRDGFLSHRIWDDRRDRAHYIEISRRVTLIASATTLEPLIELFVKIGDDKVDAGTFLDLLKMLPEPVAIYFAKQPGRYTTGYQLAKDLPALIRQKEIATIAKTVRGALLNYLERQIPGFRDLSDLVVVDLGYSASIQKSLRKIFDIENLPIRLHGLYLSTNDGAFHDLDADDTAEGFISDLVFSPHIKRMLNRNIAMLEQMCCSATGSVRSYGNDSVVYEVDKRSKSQIATALEIQDGVLAFNKAAAEIGPAYEIDAFNDLVVTARWAAATLARLLLLPTDSELDTLTAFKHDVNLGSQSVVSMIDPQFVDNIATARDFPVACMAPAPPMWLAGSFARLSSSNAFQYMLFGANQLPNNVFGETKCGSLQIGLFKTDGSAVAEDISVYRTADAKLRIRIPVSQSLDLDAIAIPLAKIVTEGLVEGLLVQYGKTVQAATASSNIDDLPISHLTFADFSHQGPFFRATNSDACVILKIGTLPQPVMVLTLAIAPINQKVMSIPDNVDEFEDELKAALLDLNA